MRTLDWFDRQTWLEDQKGLRPGDLVRVEGHVYRYEREKAKDGTLTHLLVPEATR